jgi:hypothetical protein
MSKIVDKNFILEFEPPDKCELCGKLDELRPYGPNKERICYNCAMKDKETAKKRFKEDILDKVNQVIDNSEGNLSVN